MTIHLPFDFQLALEILTRVTGVLLIAPALSSRSLPRSARLLLTIAITAALLPVANGPRPLDIQPSLLVGLIGELAMGLAIGLTAEIVFAAIDVSSQAITFASGLSIAQIMDPAADQRSTSLTSLQWLIATGIFLAVDGHHLILHALHTSLAIAPPGTVKAGAIAESVVGASSALFSFGLALAAPALVIVLLIDLAIGLAGRVAPHTQVLLIGMGLKPLAAFAAMALVCGTLPAALSAALSQVALDIGEILAAAARGGGA